MSPTGPQSARLRRRALRRLPGGVSSNVRLAAPAVFFARGRGAWLWDVDGNDYVDYLLGQGSQTLGHAHPTVTAAVAEACRTGMVFGAQHPLELEATERVCDALGWADMARLGLTGTEMVQAALRLARAATGRRRFIRFHGHYHGWLDNVLAALDGTTAGPPSGGQLPEAFEQGIALRWNDADEVEDALDRHGDDVAAVLLEPMMCNAGAIVPAPGYLARLRRLCDESGALLVFDEVITGFRLAYGGAAERFAVAPDLATYGKAMAGGWPVAALAGRGELMERLGSGAVTHSGTFNASVMAAAAVVATLGLLADDPPYERIARHGEAMMAGLRQLADKAGLPLRVEGLPAAFHCSLSSDPEPLRDLDGVLARDPARYAAFARRLFDHGVWVAARGIWYTSAVHGEAETRSALERVEAALEAETTGQGR